MLNAPGPHYCDMIRPRRCPICNASAPWASATTYRCYTYWGRLTAGDPAPAEFLHVLQAVCNITAVQPSQHTEAV